MDGYSGNYVFFMILGDVIISIWELCKELEVRKLGLLYFSSFSSIICGCWGEIGVRSRNGSLNCRYSSFRSGSFNCSNND